MTIPMTAGGVATAESRVTGGRVQIPASVRKVLGLTDEDRLLWISDAAGVRVTTRRALTEAVWAANTGGDAVDTVEAVRSIRRDDITAERRAGDADDWEGVDTGTDALVADLFPRA